jgi:hypothetical protein
MDRNLRCGMFNAKNDANKMLYGEADLFILTQEREPSDALAFCDEHAAINPELQHAALQPSVGVKYFGGATISTEFNAVVKAGDFVVRVNYNEEDPEKVQFIESVQILSYGPVIFNGEPSFVLLLESELPEAETEFQEVILVRTFKSRVGLAPFIGGDPALTKKFTTIHTHLQGCVRELTLDVSVDQHRETQSVTIDTINPLDGWGAHDWGNFAWGNDTPNAMPALDTYVPRGYNIDRLLNVTVENNGFNQDLKLQRVSVDFDNLSKRSK